MSQKIIKPEGMELIRYLNEGYKICNTCGAVMDLEDDPADEMYMWVCPSCGWKVDMMEYEYENDEAEEWTDDVLNAFGGCVPPAGCMACGGPYPYCETSCEIFDD